MSAAKTVTRGIVIWLALGSVASADGIDSSSWRSSGSWYFFFQGRSSKVDSPPSYTNFYSNQPIQNALPVVNTPPPAPIVNIPAPAPIPIPIQAAPVQPTLSATNSFSTPVQAPTNIGNTYDAYINLGSSGFLESNQLTTGNPQPWYASPTVQKLFNGIPSIDQQKQFTDQVLSDVQQTFSLAGLHPSITTNPNVSANHTLSVVSGASYGPNANAIGITDVGSNGFGFIDKLSYGNDINSLEWAVAHNVSHELMHAFGVGQHPDSTGNFIDAATASWNLLTNPNATFSSGAVTAIQATNFGNVTSSVLGAQGLAKNVDGDQQILAATVPEPATIAVWGLLAACAVVCQRRRRILVSV